jgi:hypothetical protein
VRDPRTGEETGEKVRVEEQTFLVSMAATMPDDRLREVMLSLVRRYGQGAAVIKYGDSPRMPSCSAATVNLSKDARADGGDRKTPPARRTQSAPIVGTSGASVPSTCARKPLYPARRGPTRRGQGPAMRIPQNQDRCRLQSKQGSDYAGVPRPASARFRSAICPAW